MTLMAEIPLVPDIRAPMDVVMARRLVICGARLPGGSEEQTRGQSSAQQLLLHKRTPAIITARSLPNLRAAIKWHRSRLWIPQKCPAVTKAVYRTVKDLQIELSCCSSSSERILLQLSCV